MFSSRPRNSTTSPMTCAKTKRSPRDTTGTERAPSRRSSSKPLTPANMLIDSNSLPRTERYSLTLRQLVQCGCQKTLIGSLIIVAGLDPTGPVPSIATAWSCVFCGHCFTWRAGPIFGRNSLTPMEGTMTVVRASARATKRGAADTFTGEVFQDEVLVGQAPSRMRATVVSFTPGARTAWHAHPIGQTLYCLSGVGRICIGKGSRPEAIYPGDTVMIPPDNHALAWRSSRPAVQPSGDVGNRRSRAGHRVGRAGQRDRI
jgi:quercetin dioxygenase-like cupin family protein